MMKATHSSVPLTRTLRVMGVQFYIRVGEDYIDPICQAIARNEYAFSPAFELMFSLMRPGQTVLDLGAHVGTFSLAAAALGCRVIAVEASPYNVGLLNGSIASNSYNNVRVVAAAVGDRPGTVKFMQQGAYGTVCPLGGTGIEVPAITVDGLMAELGINTVDVIKLDVEGSEVAAIRGMARLLAQAHAPVIMYECNALTLWPMGESTHTLINSLTSYGYTSYAIDAGRLIPVKAEDLQPTANVDHLAVKAPLDELGLAWPVTQPMSQEERLAKILWACTAADFFERLYIAQALREADDSITRDPRVADALSTLVVDPNEEVRSAASWYLRGQQQIQRLQAIAEHADVMLRGYQVRSRIPALGGLITWIRKNLTSHLREPYIDPTFERQVIFNRELALENLEMARMLGEVQERLVRLENQTTQQTRQDSE